MTGVPEALARLRGGLIVSCQAPPDEPLSGPWAMSALARSVVQAGAVGIRAEGLDDLKAVRAAVEVPLIGLWKDGDGPVYITPTIAHAAAVAATGADVVAFDATTRRRPDGSTVTELITTIHEAGALAMADVSTVEEGLAAAAAAADALGTTLSGYTPYSAANTGPDLALVERLAARADIPVIAEGRIATPEEAQRALRLGAWAVVVGTAITRPSLIAARFVEALRDAG